VTAINSKRFARYRRNDPAAPRVQRIHFNPRFPSAIRSHHQTGVRLAPVPTTS
jgi:hypothetical protein